MSNFTKDSEEVINARQTSNSADIYSADASTKIEKDVFIKNVSVEGGKKYFHRWKSEMYEIETNIGVFISAKERHWDQNNPISTALNSNLIQKGGAPVNWENLIGKELNVITGPTKEPTGWLWVYYVS